MDFLDLKPADDNDVEMRCPGTLQAIMKSNEELVEIKCHHIRCTQGKPVSVFHYYSAKTGELVDTKTFQDVGRKFTNARSQ